MVELFFEIVKYCIKETLLHRFYSFFIPFITRKITINSTDLNLSPYSSHLLKPSNNHSPPCPKGPPFPTSKMQFYVFINLLSLLALSHTAPVPQPDENPVDIVSSSNSPFSVRAAGDADSDTGFYNGDPIAVFPRNDNPVDVVSNSVSPLSANNAGNTNSNTGLLNGADVTLKRDAQSSDAANVISNSLSPLSDNVAGDNNKNTGTLDGNTVTVDPQIDPTIAV